MTALLLSLALSQAANPDQGIVGGFNPQWILADKSAGGTAGEVTLTVGSAMIDGVTVINSSDGGFPNDIAPIQATVGSSNFGLNFVAYCYIVDLVGTAYTGSPWFASSGSHYFDFVCEATQNTAQPLNPTADGHPRNPLYYPAFEGPAVITHAIFVGSVIGSNAPTITYPFSVFPFYRNGDQVIYATDTTCGTTYYPDGGDGTPCSNINSGWELGIPTGLLQNPAGVVRSTQIHRNPSLFNFDFTQDGLSDSLPLSASQVILETEGYSGGGLANAVSTLCFIDPNHVNDLTATPNIRSCQSELLMDGNNSGSETSLYQPLTPFRTQINIGYSDGGAIDGGPYLGSYGEIWLGGNGDPTATSQTYFDLAYRGYVEPERQLIPYVGLPHLP